MEGKGKHSRGENQVQEEQEKETDREVAVWQEPGGESSPQRHEQTGQQHEQQGRKEARKGRRKGWELEGTREEKDEEIRAARSRIQENLETTAEILTQERMQLQQEEELRKVAKLEVARKCAENIAARPRPIPYWRGGRRGKGEK